jgi:hypothetical protein
VHDAVRSMDATEASAAVAGDGFVRDHRLRLMYTPASSAIRNVSTIR